MMSIAQVRSAGSAAGYYSDRDNTRLISPREAAAEGVTLYNPETIRVGAGAAVVSNGKISSAKSRIWSRWRWTN